jgi:hypothetical protein
MGSGVTFGVTSWNFSCRDCNYRGAPLEFETEKAYQQFLSGLKGMAKEPSKSIEDKIDDVLDDTVENKQFKEIVEEAEKDCSPLCDEHPFQNKKWLPEVIVASILSAILTFTLIPNLLLIMNQVETTFVIVGFFLFGILSMLVTIVIVEYFIIMIKRKVS